MKKLTMLLALGAAVALMPSTSKATIVGSSHDFNANTNLWIGFTGTFASGQNSPYKTNSVCSECHQIHHSQDPSKGPLWVHKSSIYGTPTGYTTYEQAGSETYDAIKTGVGDLATPALGSASIACLSCHDGTVGINETTTLLLDGTLTYTNKISGGVQKLIPDRIITVGQNDLTHTHPIGINYVSAASALPNDFVAPATGVWPKTRLKGAGATQLECATCHDIHSIAVIPSGSLRCLACHKK